MKADRLLALLTAKLPAEYTRRAELTEAFRNLLRPIYADLFASDRFLTENAPIIARETHARLVAMADTLLHLSQTYGSLAKSLDDLRQLRRSDLEALAFRFGLAPPLDATADQLLDLLKDHAEDRRMPGSASNFGFHAGAPSLVSSSAIAQVPDLQERLSGQVASRAEQALADLTGGPDRCSPNPPD